jgi:subtilisin family serine protease
VNKLLLLLLVLPFTVYAENRNPIWFHKQLQSAEAIQFLEKKTAVKNQIKPLIAIIDTGIDFENAKIRTHLASAQSIVHPLGSAQDHHGHGTHVSSIILSINPRVRILPIQYIDPPYGQELALENSVQALNQAIDAGANIINYSAGGYGFSTDEFLALRRAEEKGILVIAAAGNEGTSNDKKKYFPASYHLSNIIAVAATNDTNELIPESNFGIKNVSISAPGKDISGFVPGQKLATMSGTSQATAFVTGVASLILEQKGANYPMALLKQKILMSGIYKESLKRKTASGNVVNAYRALTMRGLSENAMGAEDSSAPGLLVDTNQVISGGTGRTAELPSASY